MECTYTHIKSCPKQQQQTSIPSVPISCVFAPFSMGPSVQASVTGAAQRRKQRRLRSWWRHEQQSIAVALGHVVAPLLTRTEEGQGRGGGERDEVHGQVPDDSSSPAGALPLVRRRAWRGAACQPGRAAAATGAGPEAHRGAHRRPCACCPHGADPRCSCAADGGTAARHPPFL